MTIKQQGGIFGRNPEFNKVSLPDDGQINFGNSDDLSIYHNGSASYIVDSGTGNLFVQGNNLAFKNADSSKSYLFATNGGDVSLYYDGAVKFQTKTGGAKVVGDLAFNSGNGIDFSATSGTGTSELFSDYEEGLFELTMTPATSGTITLDTPNNECSYTKVGRQVFVTGMVIVSAVASPVGASIAIPLPFATANLSDSAGRFTGVCTQNSSGSYVLTPIYAIEGSSTADLLLDASTVSGAKRFYFSFTYITA